MLNTLAQRSSLNARRSTLVAQRSSLNARRSTLVAQCSILDARYLMLNALGRHLTFDVQRAMLAAHRSTPSLVLDALFHAQCSLLRLIHSFFDAVSHA